MRGIAVSVDDPSVTFAPREVGLRGLSARPRSPSTVKCSANPLVDFALLQSMTRAGPSTVPHGTEVSNVRVDSLS